MTGAAGAGNQAGCSLALAKRGDLPSGSLGGCGHLLLLEEGISSRHELAGKGWKHLRRNTGPSVKQSCAWESRGGV